MVSSSNYLDCFNKIFRVNELLFISVLLLINAFVIIGWNRATYFETEMENTYEVIISDSKMILWKLRYWFEYNFGEWAAKPFFSCTTCMASVHSIYVYWLFMPLTIHSLIIYPIYILSLAGLATYINNRV